MFSAADLTNMRATQDIHMMDTGVRMVQSSSVNDFGETIETFTAAVTAIACGLEMRSGNETNQTDKTVIQYDAVLRLPIGTTIDPKDRWKITKRFGETVTNITFQIVSPIQRGASGIRVLLKKVDV